MNEASGIVGFDDLAPPGWRYDSLWPARIFPRMQFRGNLNNTKIQRWCAWSGFIAVNLFVAGFLIAHFLPPPGPWLTQAEVVAMYQQNATDIRIGMVVMLIGSMFFMPMVGLVSDLLGRIEGGGHLLAYIQLCAGALNIVFVILPAVMFLITSYRPDRAPELTFLMNDFSWIIMVIVWPPAFMQQIAVAAAILYDKSTHPIFPRWVAFFNVWVALLYVPGCLLPFFKSGPFAWNGILVFWLGGGAFLVWYWVMLVVLLKTIKRQEQGGGTRPSLEHSTSGIAPGPTVQS